MPTVPRYDNFQVAPNGGRVVPFQAPQASTAPGQQVQQAGAALSSVSNDVAQIAIQAQEHANQVRLNDAMNKAIEAEQNRTHAEGGYTHLRGSDALFRPDEKGLDEEYSEQLSKDYADITHDLGNDTQRAAFSQWSQQRLTQFRSRVQQYRNQEYVSYQGSVQDGTIKVATQQMALDWGDPEKVYESRQAIKAAAFRKGKLEGLSASEIEANTVAVLSAGHAAVVASAIDAGQLDYARAHFDDSQKELTPDVADRLRDELKTGDIKDESLRLSLELDGTLSQQRAELNRMYTAGEISVEVRDATLTRVTQDNAARKAAKAEGAQRAMGDAQNWVLNNPGKTVHDLPAHLYGALQSHGQLQTIANFAKQGGKYTNDSLAWAEIVGMSQSDLAAMTPTEFHNKYRGKLDDGHLEKGYALVLDARNEGSEDPDHLEIITTQQRMKQSAQSAGILPMTGKANETEAARYDRFQRAVDEGVRVLETTQLGGKRKASSEELQRVIDGVLEDQVFIDEWFRDPERPASVLEPDELGDAYVRTESGARVNLAEIPADRQMQYTQMLREAGLPVTQRRIAELWQADKP